MPVSAAVEPVAAGAVAGAGAAAALPGGDAVVEDEVDDGLGAGVLGAGEVTVRR